MVRKKEKKALDAHKVDKLYERAIKKIHIIKKIY